MSQAPTESQSIANKGQEFLQKFLDLQQQQNEQKDQFATNHEQLNELNEVNKKKNDESKLNELNELDELNELNDDLNDLTIIGNVEIAETGIDDRTQGDIIVQYGKNSTLNPYESLSITDFKSMKKIIYSSDDVSTSTSSTDTLLRPELLDGCVSNNFKRPSKIQATAIPICLNFINSSNRKYPNLIAQAHHGSGKTATFALIMLEQIDENDENLQGLCIVHSRELAIQTYGVIKSLGEYISNLKISLALPGRQVPDPWDCQICIGTPGTLIDRYINPLKRQPFKEFLQSFKILIIDEADEFLKSSTKNKHKRGRNQINSSSSFGSLYDQLKRIILEINNVKNNEFQTLLFSATYPNKVKKLATEIAPNAYIIRLQKKQVQLDNIKSYKIICDSNEDKFNTLLKVISCSNVGQMIVFVNTVNMAKKLVEALDNKNIGIDCSVLYGRGLEIGVRDKTMEQFRRGQTQCLIASNVIARGIDVPAVGLVVNFEIPVSIERSVKIDKTGKTSDAETFMHRVGRTGRFGARGCCINLLSKDDLQSNNILDAIQKEYSLHIEQINNDIKSIKDSIAKWLNK